MNGDDEGRGTRFLAFAAVLMVCVVLTGGIVTVTQQSGRSAPSNSTDRFPPGTGSTGVENASELLETHRTVLRRAGTYRVRQQINASRPPGSPRPDRWKWNQTATSRVDVGSSPPRTLHRRRVVRPDAPVEMQVFATPTAWHTRSRRPGGNWTGHATARNMTAVAFENWALDQSLGSGLSNFEFAYAGRFERNNTTLYRFTSTGFLGDRRQGPHSLPNTITNATATLLVDERGLVVEFQHRYAGVSTATTGSGERTTLNVSVRYRWTFGTLDGSTVREPGWANATVRSSRPDG